MGRRRWLLALGLVVAACGDSAVSTTSSTTTTVATTTTMEAIEVCSPTPIEGRGRVWEVGCSYTADSFLIPLTFSPDSDGWSSIGAGPSFVAIRHDADGDGSADATLTLATLDVESEPNTILDEIEAFDEVETLSARQERTIAGVGALILDVLGAPQREPLPECSQPRGTALFEQGTGYELMTADQAGPAPRAIGVPACYPSRFWILDIEGTPITAVGVTRDDAEFDELMAILEDFLDSRVTFGEG